MAQDAQETPHHIIKNPMPSANTLQEREISSGDLTSEEKSMQTHSDCVCVVMGRGRQGLTHSLIH